MFHPYADYYDLKNIFQLAPALPGVTSIFKTHTNLNKTSPRQSQVQPLDQAPHAQDHEADRQYQ